MYPNKLTKPSGTNAPGLGNIIYLAPKSWFATIGMPTTTPTAPGDKVTITDDHTFTVTSPIRGFVQMETTMRTQELKFTQVGEIDSYGINATIEAWSAGISAPLFELMIEQDEYIVLAKDIECAVEQYFQLGASCSGALKAGWEFATGKAGGQGKKGTTVKFDSYQTTPLLYTGAVTLAVYP